jgi:hypothetical protein
MTAHEMHRHAHFDDFEIPPVAPKASRPFAPRWALTFAKMCCRTPPQRRQPPFFAKHVPNPHSVVRVHADR